MRKCKNCGETKTFKDFYPSQKCYCKECHKRKVVLWYKNNSQKAIERSKNWQKKNPQRVKELNANWKKNNPGKAKQYREKHKERQAVYYREWYAKNGRKRTSEDYELIRKWQKANIEKVKACGKFRYTVKKGLIKIAKNCEKCKEKRRLLGHHRDYRFPLKVNWLCYSCHKKLPHEN